jgi:hypothetical protein
MLLNLLLNDLKELGMSFTENQTTFQIENANDGLIEVGKR